MKYQIWETSEYDEEFISETDSLEEAQLRAYGVWNHLSSYDKKYTKVEIRTNMTFSSPEDEESGLYSGYDLVDFDWRN